MSAPMTPREAVERLINGTGGFGAELKVLLRTIEQHEAALKVHEERSERLAENEDCACNECVFTRDVVLDFGNALTKGDL